jgi:hypothetical protein
MISIEAMNLNVDSWPLSPWLSPWLCAGRCQNGTSWVIILIPLSCDRWTYSPGRKTCMEFGAVTNG